MPWDKGGAAALTPEITARYLPKILSAFASIFFLSAALSWPFVFHLGSASLGVACVTGVRHGVFALLGESEIFGRFWRSFSDAVSFAMTFLRRWVRASKVPFESTPGVAQ